MPAAGEDEAGVRPGVVEDGLGSASGVAVDAPRDEDGEDAVTAGNGFLDNVGIVGGAWDDGDAVLVLVELGDALLAADADDFVAAVEAVLEHVLAELA